MNCLKIAADMLEVDESQLPQGLVDKLVAVNNFVRKVKPDGHLNSTQVIAYIVANYLTKAVQNVDYTA